MKWLVVTTGPIDVCRKLTVMLYENEQAPLIVINLIWINCVTLSDKVQVVFPCKACHRNNFVTNFAKFRKPAKYSVTPATKMVNRGIKDRFLMCFKRCSIGHCHVSLHRYLVPYECWDYWTFRNSDRDNCGQLLKFKGKNTMYLQLLTPPWLMHSCRLSSSIGKKRLIWTITLYSQIYWTRKIWISFAYSFHTMNAQYWALLAHTSLINGKLKI